MNLVTQQQPKPPNGQVGGLRPGVPGADLTQRTGSLPHGHMPQGLDLIGPLLRRKYVVILLLLIGCGLGYLAFVNTPPIYESRARLMIWSQAPPRVVGEESLSPQITLAKYQNLLGSQSVLGRAIEDAKLHNTETLNATDSAPLQVLRESLTVKSGEANDDTLQLFLVGPNREELPEILSNISDAFISVIGENTKAVGGRL